MPTFTFPTNIELMEVEQVKLPTLVQDDPILKLFPIVNKDSANVSWEQRDDYLGLQNIRGLNGEPPRVKRRGGKRYIYEPGVYGEFTRIDEVELTTRRPYGAFNGPVSIDDLVMEAQDQLLNRRIDRIRYIIWTLLVTGTFSISNEQGQVLHTDTYTFQTYTAAVTWATVATATPLANFRAVKLLARGKSTSFGGGATAFMNQTTFNSMISNTNAADIAGRRTSGLNTVLNLDEVNKVLQGEDLPAIVIYDDGYLDDTGTFQLFIPNNKVVVVGRRRNGAALGEYLMVRNANNPDLAAGPYMKVVDKGETQVPRQIDVHDGHNGGPAIYFPGAVVVMTV